MKKIVYLLVLLAVLATCRHEERHHFPETSEITGLAGPVFLNKGETIIYLTEFFNDVEKID